MYKPVATHKAPRIHPVKIRKKKNNKMKSSQWEAVAPKLEGFWSGEFGAGEER